MHLYRIQQSYSRYIQVTLVKEYEWCKTIPWIIANTAVEPPLTPSMQDGKEVHNRIELAEQIADSRKLAKYTVEAVLVSRRYRVVGLIDILSIDPPMVIDIKQTNKKPPKSHIAQLETYTLLAWTNNIPVERAEIVNHEKKTIYKLEVTDYVLERAKKRIQKTWRIIQQPDPPLVQQPVEKCSYCRYKTRCPNYL